MSTITQVQALINRSANVTVPVTVYEYELPVIEEVFGQLNVSVTSSKEVDAPAELTASLAYAQLMRKYSQHQDKVRAVYRTPRAISKEFDLPYNPGDDEAAKFQQSEVIINDPGQAAIADAQAKAAAAKK